MKKPFIIEVRSCDGSDKLIKTHVCSGIRSAKAQFKRALEIACRFNMYVRACDEHGHPVDL
jgi:hypothetical protein